MEKCDGSINGTRSCTLFQDPKEARSYPRTSECKVARKHQQGETALGRSASMTFSCIDLKDQTVEVALDRVSSDVALEEDASIPFAAKVPCKAPERTPSQAREPFAFLSDKDIAADWRYKILQNYMALYSRYLYQFSVCGWHQLPGARYGKPDKGCLLVGSHTFHSADIPMCMLHAQTISGHAPRGLFHRELVEAVPFLRYCGAVPGHRDIAVELLHQSCWVGVIPGGAEEIMSHCAAHGREAYTLGSWQSSSGRSRRGFAEVAQALGDGFEIFPFFCENGEEMRFAPLIELWMLLRLDWGCALLLGCFGLRTNAQVHRLLQQATFWVSLISFPVPVRVTQHIGEPVVVRAGEAPEVLAARVKDSLQRLIDERQGRRHRSYVRALCDTWVPVLALWAIRVLGIDLALG
jgi:hypothetical protein